MEIQAFSREIRRYLRQINLKNVQQMNRCIRPFGLTPSQLMILFNLDMHGEMTVSELVAHAQMPKSNISAVCGRLEENGLAERRRDSADQRLVYVSLTEKARKLLKKAKRSLDKDQEMLAQKLDDCQREQILQGLSLLCSMYDSSCSAPR